MQCGGCLICNELCDQSHKLIVWARCKGVHAKQTARFCAVLALLFLYSTIPAGFWAYVLSEETNSELSRLHSTHNDLFHNYWFLSRIAVQTWRTAVLKRDSISSPSRGTTNGWKLQRNKHELNIKQMWVKCQEKPPNGNNSSRVEAFALRDDGLSVAGWCGCNTSGKQGEGLEMISKVFPSTKGYKSWGCFASKKEGGVCQWWVQLWMIWRK